AVWSWPQPCPAQPAEPEPVTFRTVDQVQLSGTFYPGEKNGKATVLLVHALGEDSRDKAWESLAGLLHKRGHAVLSFDLRGHGKSTAVLPGKPHANPLLSETGFWDFPENQRGIRGFQPLQPRGKTIRFADFTKSYHPALVNDLAAAKAFLDERN